MKPADPVINLYFFHYSFSIEKKNKVIKLLSMENFFIKK